MYIDNENDRNELFCNEIWQEIARGKGSGNDEGITLDVHAINKLQKEFNLAPTDDKVKYKYTSDEDGNYGKIHQEVKSFGLHRCNPLRNPLKLHRTNNHHFID